MDEFKIIDAQQAELLLEIMKSYNFLIKINNEKENYTIIPDYFLNKTIKQKYLVKLKNKPSILY